MHVGAPEFVVAAAAVLLGAIVQGSVGVGLNIVAAPFVALVVPTALPPTLVLLAIPVSTWTFVREHHAVDRLALPWMLAGALPGTLLGLLILEVTDTTALTVIVACTVLTGVAISLVAPPVPTNRGTALAAGVTSNVFGTATGVGGPPTALLFQHRPGPTTRSTLGAFSLASTTLSVVGYVVTATITGDQLVFALALAPFMAAGLWTSRHFHVHVDGGWLRPAVLTLSAIAGIAALVRALA